MKNGTSRTDERGEEERYPEQLSYFTQDLEELFSVIQSIEDRERANQPDGGNSRGHDGFFEHLCTGQIHCQFQVHARTGVLLLDFTREYWQLAAGQSTELLARRLAESIEDALSRIEQQIQGLARRDGIE